LAINHLVEVIRRRNIGIPHWLLEIEILEVQSADMQRLLRYYV
jgi:hypothetical protein